MQYKLLMENWRKYLNELDLDPVMGTTDMANAVYTSKALTPKQRLKYNKSQRELAKGNIAPDVAKIFAEAAMKMAKEIALFLEPTGQISDIKDGRIRYTYEDLMDSAASAELNFKKGNYLTAGFDSFLAVLAALAMIPIIGKFFKGTRKAARFARLADKTVDGADTASKALRRSGNAKLVAKADEIDNAISKASQGPKVKKLSYNEQDVFTKHIKDNVPIAKDIALDIIKKNPDVAVKATNVYRGMRVSKEYIIKHYGAEILSKGPGTHVLEVSNKKFSPRKGTSSWALDSSEAGAWAGGYAQKETGEIGILFVGGKGPKDVGLDITKRAKQIGSKQSHFDWSEVSMLGDVEVHKVIITVGDAPKGKMHFPASKLAANDNIAPGFYEPQTRGELINFLNQSK